MKNSRHEKIEHQGAIFTIHIYDNETGDTVIKVYKNGKIIKINGENDISIIPADIKEAGFDDIDSVIEETKRKIKEGNWEIHRVN